MEKSNGVYQLPNGMWGYRYVYIYIIQSHICKEFFCFFAKI